MLVLDLSKTPSLEVISGTVSTMVQRTLPVRFGIVPMVDSDDEICELRFVLGRMVADYPASIMAKVFHYSVQSLGRGKTNKILDFVSALLRNA